MRYAIIHKETNEPIKQTGEILYFKNRASAQRYLANSVIQPSEYKLCGTPDLELKHNLINYEDAIQDIYHAIEVEQSDENLLKLAQLLKEVLRERRKDKSKAKGLRCNALNITPYQNRTLILSRINLEHEVNNATND